MFSFLVPAKMPLRRSPNAVGNAVTGAITPTRPVPRRARAIASLFGTKPSESTADMILLSVSGRTRSGELRAKDTVEILTPASLATS